MLDFLIKDKIRRKSLKNYKGSNGSNTHQELRGNKNLIVWMIWIDFYKFFQSIVIKMKTSLQFVIIYAGLQGASILQGSGLICKNFWLSWKIFDYNFKY